MNTKIGAMIRKLNAARPYMTSQQYRTIKGQILSGDLHGADIGIRRLLNTDRKDKKYEIHSIYRGAAKGALNR